MIRQVTTDQPIGRLDLLIGMVLSGLGVALMVNNVADNHIHASVLAVPMFLAVTVPLVWRRVAPSAALAAVLAALVVHAVLFGDLIRCGVVFPAAFLLTFGAAAQLDLRPALLGLGIAVAIITVACLTDVEVDASGVAPFGVIATVLWGIGRVVRSRGQMVMTLENQSLELRAARDDRARLEVATDRARLSKELETLLQRRLAELARIAEPGPPAGDPVSAKAMLVNIEREGRRTLDEMRVIVGVLRDDQAGAPTSPQPALTQLEALLVQAKGADAWLSVEGNPRVLPPSVELSAYRVVEHLLAAFEDAPDVNVLVRFREDALEIVIHGPARRRPDAAIERARERLRLHRGTLEVSVSDGRAEAVALLPVLAG